MLAERIANFRQAPPQPRETRCVTDNSSGYAIDIKVVHAAKPELACKGLPAAAMKPVMILQQHDSALDGAGPLWKGSPPSFGGRTALQQPSLRQGHLLQRQPQGRRRQCTSMSTPEGRAAQKFAIPPCKQMVQVCAACSVCIWELQQSADAVMKVLQHQLKGFSGCFLLISARVVTAAAPNCCTPAIPECCYWYAADSGASGPQVRVTVHEFEARHRLGPQGSEENSEPGADSSHRPGMPLRLEVPLLTNRAPSGFPNGWCTHSSSRLPACSGADAAELVALHAAR